MSQKVVKFYYFWKIMLGRTEFDVFSAIVFREYHFLKSGNDFSKIIIKKSNINRYKRKWAKVSSEFSTRRWVILVARTRWKFELTLWHKFACGQLSSPRLYRLTVIKSLPTVRNSLGTQKVKFTQIERLTQIVTLFRHQCCITKMSLIWVSAVFYIMNSFTHTV